MQPRLDGPGDVADDRLRLSGDHRIAWTGEAAGYDGFTPLVLAAAQAPRLRLGTAVLPVHTRGPALLAMTAASLAEAAPGRAVSGRHPRRVLLPAIIQVRRSSGPVTERSTS